METIQNNGILRIGSVCEFAGLAKSSIYQLMKEGKFPKPVKLTGKAVGWRRKDLLEWEENITQ